MSSNSLESYQKCPAEHLERHLSQIDAEIIIVKAQKEALLEALLAQRGVVLEALGISAINGLGQEPVASSNVA